MASYVAATSSSTDRYATPAAEGRKKDAKGASKKGGSSDMPVETKKYKVAKVYGDDHANIPKSVKALVIVEVRNILSDTGVPLMAYMQGSRVTVGDYSIPEVGADNILIKKVAHRRDADRFPPLLV